MSIYEICFRVKWKMGCGLLVVVMLEAKFWRDRQKVEWGIIWVRYGIGMVVYSGG